MKTKIINIWEYLRSSFWFIPALMIVAAISMAFLVVAIEKSRTLDSVRFLGLLYSVSPEGARALLSTVAGSMMTVAGVTFSITIVVLNLATSQFGPRLLRNFMQDRNTQFVLGTFVATFIYCLLVLWSVQIGGTVKFVPGFSVGLAVILALFNVGVLIFFIHHISTSIQADEVVAAISKELELNVRRIFPDEFEYQSDEERKIKSELPKEKKDHYYLSHITARRNGYLQAVDNDGLLQIAIKENYLIRIQLRPGQYVVADSTLAIVESDKIFDGNLTEAITRAFIIGSQRTPEQDVEYPIHQLVEVAIRALSPGVNDPYTAIACIDQLGSVLSYLGKREFPPSLFFDDKDKPRLQIKPFTYSGILNASFDQIRQYGSTSVAVTIRLLEMLTIISAQTRHREQRSAIHRQANMILCKSEAMLTVQNDKEDVRKRYQGLLGSLNTFDDVNGPYAVPAGVSIS